MVHKMKGLLSHWDIRGRVLCDPRFLSCAAFSLDNHAAVSRNDTLGDDRGLTWLSIECVAVRMELNSITAALSKFLRTK